ncbi:hypothetical protein J6590_000190 [Homalodisca vitripennis]|nr:hypothetical protein J6590_000190 [Homalodisca vitripennis]
MQHNVCRQSADGQPADLPCTLVFVALAGGWLVEIPIRMNDISTDVTIGRTIRTVRTNESNVYKPYLVHDNLMNTLCLKPQPFPRPCCEVLIAGTNDLAVGGQRNIYRHLEGYIAAGSSSTEIILTTLPHRHDLDPTHPVHYQTVLVNAYIEELAVRHNIRVLNFDDISRRYFTRHGQHLSWRGKRLLAGMIVAAMSPATQESKMKAQPRLWRNPRAAPASTSSMPTPAGAREESATTPQRPASIQDVSYADAVRRSPSPDILQIKGGSTNLKENSVF